MKGKCTFKYFLRKVTPQGMQNTYSNYSENWRVLLINVLRFCPQTSISGMIQLNS